MNICFYIDPAHARRWHELLARRLAKEFSANVCAVWSDAKPHPLDVRLLLAYERLVSRMHQRTAAASMSRSELEKAVPVAKAQDSFDLVIDCVGDGRAPVGKEVITLLFNGHPGELALLVSIMRSGMPQVALRDGAGEIVATAQPSAERASGVLGTLDQVYIRLGTLLCAWIRNPDRLVQPLVEAQDLQLCRKSLALRTTKRALKHLLKKGYYALCRPSHWRIGWRFVKDDDVWSRHSLGGETWQVLPDQETHFYADPVPYQKDGKYYLFFEDLDHKLDKGIISVVAFDEKGVPGPVMPCLEEKYHLSYPFLLEHEGETYMVPETAENGDVALYKASKFPFGWKRVAVLMSNIDAADVTITFHQGRWWIFCVTRDGGGYSDCLSLFYADDLFGPWQPHAQNPVLIDAGAARPAGPFLQENGKLLRPVQVCSNHYGEATKLVEVTELTPQSYAQKELVELRPDGNWPGRKLHTLARAGDLEAIDGAILRPRIPILRLLAEKIYRPVGKDGAAAINGNHASQSKRESLRLALLGR